MSCAQNPTHLDAQDDKQQHIDVAAPILEPAIKAPSPLLKDILPEDLARAQAEVKKHVLPHWPYIAERSRFVRHRLLHVLKAMNAPIELQVIPVLESGYNPYALSSAGAMGLWQLMPRTARGLGVFNKNGYDGRRNVEDSTQGAIRYLMQMYDRFGNWPLAFAAYNCGPNALARRLRKQAWQPKDGLNNMPAPAVTRTYVRHIMGFISLLHMQAITFPEPIQTQALILQAPVDLQALSKLSTMDNHDLFRFNPGLNQSQYLQDDVHINVPKEKAESMMFQQQATAPRYVQTKIRTGDSLWRLARKHHTTITRLKRLNPGIKQHLKIGQLVKVPANQLARAKAKNNPLLSHGRRIRYRVRSGDSLWVIAQRFGTTPHAIARSNQITLNSLIRPGDTLWILARIRPS